MKPPSRFLGAALPVLPRIAVAQSYPALRVRFIIGQAAGSASDIIGSVVAQWFSDRLGQRFGRGQPAPRQFGTEYVARAQLRRLTRCCW